MRRAGRASTCSSDSLDRTTPDQRQPFREAAAVRVSRLRRPPGTRIGRLPPETLVLEITETVLLADADIAIARLRALKQLGVRIAMDDFGTGYSSLSYLSRLPLDILKMDRSFLSDDMDGNGLAAAIMVIGDQFGLEVVAEGIENRAQLESLRRLGFELGQGFLFAGPMQDADLATYLRLAFAPRAA